MPVTIELQKIAISDFKRIQDLTIELAPITALVGSNTSGKSSALQAAQLGVSILQAAFSRKKRDGTPEFSATVANDAVMFRPTEQLLDLRNGSPATQGKGFSIRYEGVETEVEEVEEKLVVAGVEIKRGKNANIALTRTGNILFAGMLGNGDLPFSIFTPGLSGIPIREEWRTKGAMDAAVMHGDANLYLRTVLDHLFDTVQTSADKDLWKASSLIEILPDSKWKTFSKLLDQCFEGARVIVDHDAQHDRYVEVRVVYKGDSVTLDMASTGMLQVIQILAYSCFYKPPLLLLDEPDAHLHADSQSRLYEALRGVVVETRTKILFATHSPQLIQRMMGDAEAKLVWMENGAQVIVDESKALPTVPLLMSLGALSVGSELFDPARKFILITEDEDVAPVKALAKANGAPENIVVFSYEGCANLSGARKLAAILSEVRPDTKIVIHRDRDFRTACEVAFELALAKSTMENEGIERVTELFTPLNDVEHSFAKIEHLIRVLDGSIDELEIREEYNKQIKFQRDELVQAIRVGRNQIKANLYEADRKMKKPQRKDCGVPDKAPSVKTFLPANGDIPVEFQYCHGKKLLNLLMGALKPKVDKAGIDIGTIVYSSSEELKDPVWANACRH